MLGEGTQKCAWAMVWKPVGRTMKADGHCREVDFKARSKCVGRPDPDRIAWIPDHMASEPR